MKLEPVLESLEGIPEDFHENYEEGEDGKYHLALVKDFVPKDKVEDVTGLKSALQKERQNAKSFAQQLKEFQEKYGDIDPDEVKELRDARAKAEEEKAKAEGRWDDLKKQLNEAHQKDLAKKDQVIEGLKKTLERHLVDGQAATAINQASGSDLLLPFVKERVKVVQEDNGEFAVRVVDEHGNPKVNGQGDYMSINDLVGEMREQERYAALFKAPINGGGGGTPPNEGEGTGRPPAGKGGGSIPKDVKRSALSVKDKVAFIREHGKEAYDSLPYE